MQQGNIPIQRKPEPYNSSIIIIDIESYGSRPENIQMYLRRSMYSAMRAAIAECHSLDSAEAAFEDRGDGILILFRQASPVTLVGVLVRELDSALRAYAKAHTDNYAMRIRMAINNGLVWRDETGWVGAAINTTARLADEQQLRNALKGNPDAQLAVILSDQLYHDVVVQGHAGMEPQEFKRVRVTTKEVDAPAWICVLSRSARSAQSDHSVDSAASAETSARPEPQPRQADGASINIGGHAQTRDVAGRDINHYREPR